MKTTAVFCSNDLGKGGIRLNSPKSGRISVFSEFFFLLSVEFTLFPKIIGTEFKWTVKIEQSSRKIEQVSQFSVE